MENEEISNPVPNSEPTRSIEVLELRTRSILFYSGAIFSTISLGSIIGLFYSLLFIHHGSRLEHSTSNDTINFVDAYSSELTMILCLLVSSLFAFLSFKAAGNINRRVIPENDQKLLNELILKDEQGIDQYIRLSSLSGTTGFFTKLGLTGMPLATIGLTIFFTVLSLITGGAGLYDLAKLTLGAFLGSYVQKGGPQVFKTPKKGTDDATGATGIGPIPNNPPTRYI
jgi:hypothetical protein